MLRDVFYYGNKPNVHPREKFASSLEDARRQSTTEHFWIINEFSNYKNFHWDFDFEFLPDEDVWTEAHNNVWPSQHQKDSGTWLCPKEHSDVIVYRGDVDSVIRKNEKSNNWVELDKIDSTKFDFSWHPDPTDPPYIYKWGCKFFPAQIKHVLEYRVAGATQEKYMDVIAELLPEDHWVEVQAVDRTHFDFSWRPNPMDPPYIYVWGNKYIDAVLIPTLEYHCEGATERKYMTNDVAVLPEWDKWIIPNGLNTGGFDFSWRPDPREPDFIYEFGTQWQKTGGPQYIVFGATEKKYIDTQKVKRYPSVENWSIPSNIDGVKFDFSWHPDDTSPPYIYVFATQWAFSGGPVYTVPGATEIKYLDDQISTAVVDMSNWVYNAEEIDATMFDFSWHPHTDDQPYIYQFGTQWQKTGGPRYIAPGADSSSSVKYVDTRIIKAVRLPNKQDMNWSALYEISEFDYSWHPDETEEPYIYVFGNNQYSAEEMPTIMYTVASATKYKYVSNIIAKLGPDRANWNICVPIDETVFDFSWKPHPKSPPYIYVWGNKYVEGQYRSTVEYVVLGATEKQYMHNDVAVLPEWDKWVIPEKIDVTGFDFTWRPDPLEPNLIYEFGTQWQKTGGPRYVMEGATDTKYLDFQKAKSLPSDENWNIPANIDPTSFDFSWHPDASSPPYIYVFATQWAYSGGPVYTVPEATEIKYVDIQTATAVVDMTNWVYDSKLTDVNDFDFSWHPHADDQPYIYQFGTQWQKTGGPKYITPGANGGSAFKYVDTRIIKVKRNQNKDDPNWDCLYEIADFDWSWHPDETEEPYIYVFGNQWHAAEVMPTIEYRVPGATRYKYVNDTIATLAPNMKHWFFDSAKLDVTDFDFSWHPDPNEPEYIYEFGTQWQKTGGPRFIVPGAMDVKYIDFQKAKKLPSMENWSTPANVDVNRFDYSWHPDDTSPAYTYVFATQWALSGGPVYTVPGATEIKYIDTQLATATVDMSNWVYNPAEIDVSSFDFSWHPHVEDKPYIYQFGTQWQKTGGPKYISPGADKNSSIKYIDTRIIKAVRLTKKDDKNWRVLSDVSSFDWSWHPDETEEPYIYVFGNQWHAAEVMPTIEYRVPEATSYKYVNEIAATVAPNMSQWFFGDDLDVSKFDFSWRPDPGEPEYIYEFATQWQKTGGPRYVVPGGVEIKYMDFQRASKLPSKDNWVVSKNIIGIASFDYSWHPDATEEPYIYVFGNTQYPAEEMTTIEYKVKGATKYKYIHDIVATLLPNMENWITPDELDVADFDYAWIPHPKAPPQIYEFGTQWQKTGGPRYIVPGCDSQSPVTYVSDSKAKKLPNRSRFTVLAGAKIKNFDWSWHPDDTSPPYIYQFGNNWYSAEEMPTVEFKVSGATEAKFMTDIVATLASNMSNWHIPDGVDATRFDFSWIPHPAAKPYIYQFGTSANSKDGPIYSTPGNDGETIFVPRVETNEIVELYVGEKIETIESIVETKDSANELLDVFFVDKGNSESAARFQALKSKFGNKLQKTRYLNSWVDTINRCTNRATSTLVWILNSELDYSSFDFDYHPNLWQMKMVHVFGTQWSHWGTTFMVNRETFPIDTKYVKVIEHLSNLNFVKNIRAAATVCVHDIVVIDHGNKDLDKTVDLLQKKAPDKTVSVIKYEHSYFNTLKDFFNKPSIEKKEHYLWICSSVCDYSDFDFSYVCDPFAREQLHVFPSGKQKFGDTFFINVNKTREIINNINVLEEYDKVNYNGALRTTRLPEPVIVVNDDTHVNAISLADGFPYATLITNDNAEIILSADIEPMNLWAPETKNIIITSTGASRIIVPREIKDHVKKELYDYPYIKKAPKLSKSNPLDIIFLSNGEVGAEENWEHLQTITKGLRNRVVRVDGVNGRVAAYHAALEASNTPWAFTVFAKLKINPKFDFNWQPDRMQVPKHYIFHAKNPVNGLVYGHQAMIAYNKKLTLANIGKGLDFTLDDEHEVVPLVSGTANYNTDEFSTWRTAFREVLKLNADDSDESRERLDIWLNKAEGNFAQYSIKGAVDADEYYNEVNGDFDKLKLSYEWEWLRKRFTKL
jgi:hypothetical protein